jgi:aspartate/methionine/tyrosine aminotransferase
MVDEIYQGLVYGMEPWTAHGLPGEVVLINSFSKYFCMTGWRLGWVVLPRARCAGSRSSRSTLSSARPPLRNMRRSQHLHPQSLSVLEQRRARIRPAGATSWCRR